MTAVLDSSIIVDVLRGSTTAERFMSQLVGRGAPHSSEVVRAEILVGMRPDEGTTTRRLFEHIGWHPLTEKIAEQAGDLGRRWRPSHGGIDLPDLIIAATAQLLDLPLLTLNIRHFPMFPDLKRPY